MSHRTQIDTFWLMVAMLMLTMGVIFFGWRAMLSVTTVWLAALAAYLILSMLIQMIWPKRVPDSSLHVLTMGLLLGVSLPVMRQPWVPIAAGAALGALCHIIGRSHYVRIHPVAAAAVAAWILPALISHNVSQTAMPLSLTGESAVLHLDHLVLGDLYATASHQQPPTVWWEMMISPPNQAVQRAEPLQMLLSHDIPRHPNHLADLLSQSRLPRVEELLLGCVPGPVGATSGGILLVIGIYLMHRRLSSWGMVLGGLVAALVTIWVIPLYVQDRWTLMIVQLWQMGLTMGFVYVGYWLLASPLVWILLILAPLSAPMNGRGRVYYGAMIGAGVIIAVWITGQWPMAYLALVVASAFTRPLDALGRSPFIEAR